MSENIVQLNEEVIKGQIKELVRKNTDKLDVNYSAGTVSVPDAQALYIMSLITQSIAGTANTSDNNDYKEFSPSYGYKGYLNGVARLGDYTDVGCGSDKAKADYLVYTNAKFDPSVIDE